MVSTAIRQFLEVVRCGSIAQAAQNLHVAASAVSRQVAKLEAMVGVPLFERRPRGMALSEAGRQLAAYASASSLEAERVLASIRQRGATGQATVRIACTEGFAQHFLPQALARYKQRRPEARFHVHVDHGREVGRRVAEGHAHIGIRYGLTPDPRLHTQVVCSAPVYAIMCKRHPLAGRKTLDVRHLSEYPLALGDTDTTVRELFDICCANAGVHMEPAYVTNHSAAFLPLLPGERIVALSGYLVAQGQPHARRLAAVPFANPEMQQRVIQLLTLQGHVLAPMAADFLAFVGRELTKAAGPGAGLRGPTGSRTRSPAARAPGQSARRSAAARHDRRSAP